MASTPAYLTLMEGGSLLRFIHQSVDLAIPLIHAGIPAIETRLRGAIFIRGLFLGRLGILLLILRLGFVLILLLRRIDGEQRQRSGAQTEYKSEPGKA